MNHNEARELAFATRVPDKVWNALTDVYWLQTLSQLTARHTKHILGENEGFEFSATFKIETHNGVRKLRATVTPKRAGRYITNMTRWRWFALEPKLRGQEVDELT